MSKRCWFNSVVIFEPVVSGGFVFVCTVLYSVSNIIWTKYVTDKILHANFYIFQFSTTSPWRTVYKLSVEHLTHKKWSIVVSTKLNILSKAEFVPGLFNCIALHLTSIRYTRYLHHFLFLLFWQFLHYLIVARIYLGDRTEMDIKNNKNGYN